jgi:UDP-3-O-[3-hydroxymyristoyl] glucosamine N-acyltransferase
LGARSYRLCELAELVGGTVVGDGQTLIRGVAGIREAEPGEITFLANPKYEEFLGVTRASAVITGRNLTAPKPVIHIDNPYYAYLQVLNLFAADVAVRYPRGVHESAVVDPGALLGGNVAIGPLCHVGKGARVGDNSTLVGGVFVGEAVEIGSDCLVYPHVTIREGSVIGNRVILQPGVVIGADGFGYAKNGSTHHKVPQIGRVVIEDDVEIGANTCIDRATTGETRVKSGTKIDNLVQIAHNVVMGENCVVAAQAGISGSTEVGSNVVMGGQAGVGGHIVIGERAMVGAQAGVTKDVAKNTAVSGYPAREHMVAKRLYAHTALLPDLFKRVKELERRLLEMEKGGRDDPSAKNDR